MNEYALTLDLAKAKQRQQQTIFLRQGDQNGTTIVATITDHGAAASTSGMTARFSMRLPNGTEYYRKTATLSGNVATVTIDEAQAASAVGRTDVAYFQLLQGSTVVASTESFTVIVLPDALADADVAESYDSAIQGAIDALDAAVEQMPDMVEDVLADHPEWTTIVQDGSITEAKLATDLALERERLLYRLANMLTNALPEGETATASDAAKTPVAGLALYGRSTQDGTPTPSAPVPIVSVEAANLYQTVASQTISGVTFTANADGSVTLNGTATATINQETAFTVPETGTYRLSGCPSGGSGSTYQLWTYDTITPRDPQIIDTGSGGTGTLTQGHIIVLRIRVQSGYTCSNLTFYPMLNAGSTAYPYVPYGHAGLWAKRTSDASTYTVTPIPLDGHELRSLPDGTRDELTVDEYGHAVLTQRVGHVVLDGSEGGWEQKSTNTSGKYKYSFPCGLPDGTSLGNNVVSNWTLCDRFTNASDAGPNDGTYTCHTGVSARRTASGDVIFFHTGETLANWKTWLASNPTTIDYALATPQTIDLGYVDAVPLVGPDLTAQAIPTAPMQLTYERDLNTTLARLESAIATLA